jgi:hypothetical protein
MSIEPLSSAVRDYLRAFDLIAIAMAHAGHISTTRDPAGTQAA